jgi:hypothetical protein
VVVERGGEMWWLSVVVERGGGAWSQWFGHSAEAARCTIRTLGTDSAEEISPGDIRCIGYSCGGSVGVSGF